MANGLVLEVNGRQYSIGSRGLSIGRGPGSKINLSDSEVSRRHATVWLNGGVAYIRDDGSKNGTFVNGERIDREQRLRSGDRIKVGNTNITVRVGVGVAAEPSNVWIFAAVIVGVLILVAGAIFFFSTSAPPQAAMAAVYIGTLPDPAAQPPYVPQLGSGTIVDSRGYILTSNDTIRAVGCPPNPPAAPVSVGLIPSVDRPPEKYYIASVICTDPGANLALLRITASIGLGPIPPGLVFPTVPIGHSDSIQPSDKITLIGYVSSSTPVNLTQGIISGFLPGLQGVRSRATTNAAFPPGIYGGMGLNASGQLVAIPVGVTPTTPPLPISLVPIELARGLLARIP